MRFVINYQEVSSKVLQLTMLPVSQLSVTKCSKVFLFFVCENLTPSEEKSLDMDTNRKAGLI
jgi:hypothetical protein